MACMDMDTNDMNWNQQTIQHNNSNQKQTVDKW